MAWFRVEDSFHFHPKVRAAGNAAIGLWLRCATYAAHYGTDGAVPADVALGYGKRREIDALVISGLWLPNGDGWVMHDYLDYNPTAEQVRAKRAAARARMARQRRNDDGQFD